jgi:hypothetical protein
VCVRLLILRRCSHIRERLEHFDTPAPEQDSGSRAARLSKTEAPPPLVSEYVFPTGGTPVTLERFTALRKRYMRLTREKMDILVCASCRCVLARILQDVRAFEAPTSAGLQEGRRSGVQIWQESSRCVRERALWLHTPWETREGQRAEGRRDGDWTACLFPCRPCMLMSGKCNRVSVLQSVGDLEQGLNNRER